MALDIFAAFRGSERSRVSQSTEAEILPQCSPELGSSWRCCPVWHLQAPDSNPDSNDGSNPESTDSSGSTAMKQQSPSDSNEGAWRPRAFPSASSAVEHCCGVFLGLTSPVRAPFCPAGSGSDQSYTYHELHVEARSSHWTPPRASPAPLKMTTVPESLHRCRSSMPVSRCSAPTCKRRTLT